MIHANKTWLARNLPAPFQPFVSAWRDNTSAPADLFCKWRLNGEHIGYFDTQQLPTLLHVFNACGMPCINGTLGVECTVEANQQALSAALMSAGNMLKALGLAPGWRHEEQLLLNQHGEVLGQAERALFKTLGLRSRAVHVHVENCQGMVWTGVRSKSKYENPSMLDNLAAGGVASAETVERTLWRELDEEAGLDADDFNWIKPMTPHELVLSRPLLYGGWHHETVILFRGQLKPGRRPCNRDCEVDAFQLMSRSACIRAINARLFTPDAALCCALALSPPRINTKGINMLLGLKAATYRIGTTVLLDQVDFSIEERERVALVGRNGTGKSTLFRILTGETTPEDGLVIKQDGLRMACLEQAVPHEHEDTIFDVVAQGFGTLGKHISTSRTLGPLDHDTLTTAQAKILEEAQHELGEHHGWHLESEVDQMLSRMKLPPDLPFAKLSGGMKRKVMLAKAMVSNPDVLLLDEPTNHLDIPSIELLEEQIRQFKGAVIFVSHDRSFMRKLATRVCDLDRGMLKSWSGGYEGYLKGKAEFMHAQEKSNALFDKKLAEEEVWIRRGIEARRTRNEGRVRALMDMRKQFSDRRNVVGTAKVQVQEAERSGKVVAELTDINKQLGDLPILRNFTNTILRGEKIGFLGPNGIGKTTALKVLLGQLPPDSGHIKLGTKLEIAYFDQLRSQFNEEDTAVEIIGAGKEFITIDGQAKHVIGYLQDFLFTPDRARQPVRSLSGGERARLILAQLFSTPSNVMVLDEPTNDLDIETLELLEEKLMAYQGTLILVSHDREFLNQIVTRCLVFEGNGLVGDYVGGYDDWLRQRTTDPWANVGKERPAPTVTPQPAEPAKKTKKLGYKEQRELEMLPALIESLENEQAELVAKIGEASFYQQEASIIATAQARMSTVDEALLKAYARWEELD